MKYLLDALLPRILPEDVGFQTIAHSGKKDLEKSIPRKLRGWGNGDDFRFVIVHDQDNKDCKALKKELVDLCSTSGRPFLVRIACQEMEAWYFGDVPALAAAYGNPKLLDIAKKKKYRIPDKIPTPKEELYRLIPEHQPILGARRVAPYMSISDNKSVSFNYFVSGIRRLIEE